MPKFDFEKAKDLHVFTKKGNFIYFLGKKMIPDISGGNYYSSSSKYRKTHSIDINGVPSKVQISIKYFCTKNTLKIRASINYYEDEIIPYDPKLIEIYKDVLSKKIPFGIFFDYLKDISTGRIGRM